jgi:SSS family transporter
VLAVYLAGTSWLADRLAGSRQTIRDFFLGGRKLPWWAVSGSIVASEVSGVTFVSVPAIAFAKGGNYTYLMLVIGTLLARVLIGMYFVPAYYRREIYSPYEFMGQRLGPAVDRVTTGLFILGALLAQGARLFLAALVLSVITGFQIGWAIAAVGAISVAWTWLGGINSVVWTDVVQFVILFVGGIVALVAVVLAVPGGAGEIVRLGAEAGKFVVWDARLDRLAEFTVWTGVIGSSFLTLASHGTDQNMTQRLFCCRDEREARKAVIWSGVSQLLPVLMLTVGVGIYAYFERNPMTADQAAMVAKRRDYVFPFFILAAMPAGVKGLLFAAIFSAATATGTLAALAQTALAGLYRPLFPERKDERHLLFVSRVFVAVAAAGLCGVAFLCSGMNEVYPDLLRLALNMAAYTYGALLGTFLLALLPLSRDARGLVWGVPYSVLLVLAFNWQHVEGVRYGIAAAVALLVLCGLRLLLREPLKLAGVFLGGAGVLAVTFAVIGRDPAGHPLYLKLAFPWLYPIGAAVTLGLGVALGRKRVAGPDAPSLSSNP